MRTLPLSAITSPIIRVQEHLDALSDNELEQLSAVLDHVRRLVGSRRCVRLAFRQSRMGGQQ